MILIGRTSWTSVCFGVQSLKTQWIYDKTTKFSEMLHQVSWVFFVSKIEVWLKSQDHFWPISLFVANISSPMKDEEKCFSTKFNFRTILVHVNSVFAISKLLFFKEENGLWILRKLSNNYTFGRFMNDRIVKKNPEMQTEKSGENCPWIRVLKCLIFPLYIYYQYAKIETPKSLEMDNSKINSTNLFTTALKFCFKEPNQMWRLLWQ